MKLVPTAPQVTVKKYYFDDHVVQVTRTDLRSAARIAKQVSNEEDIRMVGLYPINGTHYNGHYENGQYISHRIYERHQSWLRSGISRMISTIRNLFGITKV
jgi:hypothetical protein